MSDHESGRHRLRTRTTRSLNAAVEKRLLGYTAAAAAGMAIFAAVKPAEAKVVFTPLRHFIPIGTGFNLDLNNDGTTDFFLYNFWFDSHSSYNSSIGFLSARGSAGVNRVITQTSQRGLVFARALPSGVQVGPGANFGRYEINRMIACGTDSHSKHRSGPFLNVKQKYLGLKFIINGQIHYGWARFSTQQVTFCKIRAQLNGYAYESDPNTPITTGQISDAGQFDIEGELRPNSNGDAVLPGPGLGMLGLGAPGLEAWRKE